MKPLGKDDHLDVTRARVPIWNPSFVKSNLPRVCRNSSDMVKVSHCENEQVRKLCHTNGEKAAKSGAIGSDGASNKNKTKCLIKKADKGRQNSPVNLNIVLSVFARLESETQWNNEKEVKLALQSMLEMTLKPRFELEWGLATKDQQSVGLQLFDKINANLSQKDAETILLIESVSSKIRQGWFNL